MKNVWKTSKQVWKFLVLLFLILLTFSYGMFQGGFVSWFLFYSFLPFALYSLVIFVYPLKELKVKRTLRKQDFNAGETLTVTISVRRSFPLPLFYMIVEDQLAESLKDSFNQKILLYPGIKKEFIKEYTINDLPRGEHFFHSVTLRIGDPLGLIEREKLFAEEEKIIVYPAYTEVLYRPFENQYDQGMTASRERVQRDTTMAIGVREYQPGDKFSWINWKATAKRNDIMTKEFEQRQSHDVFVVMDCVSDSRFESIVSFTASLLRAVIKKGAQTGLLTYGKERVFFPIRGGEEQLQQLFYHLATIQPKSNIDLNHVLENDPFFIQQSVSFMLVTAQLTKEIIERASFLGQRKGAITIFLLKGEKESPSQTELSLKTLAIARGVRIVLVHQGNFAAVFSGVNLR